MSLLLGENSYSVFSTDFAPALILRMNTKRLDRSPAYVISLSLFFLYTAGINRPAIAQINPDQTLGAENSILIPGGTTGINGPFADLISGGAQRGANVFHSFSEFNIDEGQQVYFENPVGVNIIFSRVTGASQSNILGTLGVLGNADLFLLNPNGIIFGLDAQLDLGGSLIATTADSVLFDDTFAYSASNPQAVPLLSVNVPVGLQYGSNPGRIVNQSVSGFALFAPAGLQVQPEQTIALLGGDIEMLGGSLTTQSGRIEIGSVGGNSIISLTSTNPGWTVSYEGVENFQDINLSEAALAIDEDGGGIQLQGRRINLSGGAQVYALNLGAEAGETLTVRASESVELNGIFLTGDFATGLFSETQGTRAASNIDIETQQLRIQDGAQIASYDPSSTGEAGSGKVSVNASEFVEVVGVDSLGIDASFITTQGFVGNGGDLSVTTGRLVLRDGGRLTTSTFGSSQGGRLEVNASDSVELIGSVVSDQGRTFQSGLFSRSEPSAIGAAGEVVINTNNLIVQDGAE
ncbi:MAG: filamentous hemagglutinin N-terminal domain-containing protein, partial [Coleofasciculus sp. S288]|nr:filamentous hemagglutinin N-terminal domain-containing protein [Coleofasciculus sp. S288]